AVADPTRLDANANLSRAGLRDVSLHKLEIRPGFWYLHRSHLCHLSSSYALMNDNRSVFTCSLWVVHSPCGAPGYTLRYDPWTSLDDRCADAPMGTIWSSSPWMMSVGTLNFFRSSV